MCGVADYSSRRLLILCIPASANKRWNHSHFCSVHFEPARSPLKKSDMIADGNVLGVQGHVSLFRTSSCSWALPICWVAWVLCL